MTTYKQKSRFLATRWQKSLLVFLFHAITICFAYWFAYLLRFEFAVPPKFQRVMLVSLPFVLSIKLAVFWALRSFSTWWRHVSFHDMLALGKAMIFSFLMLVVFDHLLFPFWIPRSILIIDSILAGLMLGIVRSSWRIADEGAWTGTRISAGCTGVLMICNSAESVVLAGQVNATPGSRYRIVGLLTDDTGMIGSIRGGIPVVGKPEDVQLASDLGAEEIWLPAGALPGKRLKEIRHEVNKYPSPHPEIKVIHNSIGAADFSNSRIPVRDIDIRDLLQREPVELNLRQLTDQIHGKRVLVTGAGGSIGSELCRQLLRFQPSDLVLVDHRENSVFLVHQELSQNIQARNASECTSNGDKTTTPGTLLHPCVGDILDKPRMRSIFELHRPHFVYHAAAHKHVGLMESNPGEAIKTNVFGTKIVADLSAKFFAEKFVLISTDKAVNPTSVMGATKQIAERYVNALDQEQETVRETYQPDAQASEHASASPTRFVVVRFGNVLGSNGSVVPIFKKQIADGGPITVTDDRMTRYFMTIPEASQLVLQAASMGNGGEIFVLEMGEQIKIAELATELIRLSGLPEDAIDIEFVGMRPGEKLFEELSHAHEQLQKTGHPKILAAYPAPVAPETVNSAIAKLEACIHFEHDSVKQELNQCLERLATQNQDSSRPNCSSSPLQANQRSTPCP